MRWRRARQQNTEINPEDIFIDSANDATFDRARFEGRIERPLSHTTFLALAGVFVVVFGLLLVRAGYVQVVQGDAFARQSAQNSLESTALFAPRGIITDRHGAVLVENIDANKGTGTGRRYLMPQMGQIIGYVSYPKKDSSGHYYDTEITGVAGLEAEYNEVLTGTNGRVLVEKDAVGDVRSSGMIVPPRDGSPLTLTVDASLERHFAEAIARTADTAGFIAGAGVIMDVHTGDVHAIVSYPSYDPNVMSNGSPVATIASYNTSQGHPFLDHAVQGVYVPGSIVKPIVAAGALTDGVITPQTQINDPGRLAVPDPYHPGKTYYYNGWRALGIVDVSKAIAWSSDVFFYTVGGGFGDQRGLGIDRLDHWYSAFGLGHTTGIDLPGEASGVIPSPAWKAATFKEPWYLGDTYFTSIGQYGTLVTPIQMVRAAAAIANGGTLVQPRMLVAGTPTRTAIDVSSAALTVVRQGMRQSVTGALARALDVPYIEVAAKTGTAQTGVHNEYDNSWVIGFFPYQQPKYAFAVVLERGPSGAGEQSVNVMRALLDSLKRDDSTYVGGSGAPTTTAGASAR